MIQQMSLFLRETRCHRRMGRGLGRGLGRRWAEYIPRVVVVSTTVQRQMWILIFPSSIRVLRACQV